MRQSRTTSSTRRDWEPVDNSHHDVKRQLREQFAGEVEGNLCFDLFCGTGTFTREVYLSRFLQIICVDQKVESLKQLPDSPRVVAYQGDNRELGWRLRCKWGFPDFIDLDAYGNPDATLLPLLKMTHEKERFAVVATDGTFAGRKRAKPAPPQWSYGDAHWAPMCVNAENYHTLIYRHLQKWLGGAGYAMNGFVLHKPVGRTIWYYGFIAERR
jgi:hypothetical protein